MGNLINQGDYEQLLSRIEKLTPDTQRHWGVMTINQMICHSSDSFREILGDRQTDLGIPEEMREKVYAMIMTEAEWEKSIPTFKANLQGEGGGTKPVNFDVDKAQLTDLVKRFNATSDDYRFSNHPGLGVLNRERFGYFLWKHTDHHLRQFGL